VFGRNDPVLGKLDGRLIDRVPARKGSGTIESPAGISSKRIKARS